jgi:hypothetical protein
VWISSGAFFTPLGGDPQQISTYHPINMCVHKGDYLDFNDIGGNEWWWGNYDGMPFLTFARASRAATHFYTKNNGTNIGSRWAPAERKDGEELLMQMQFATGPDATDICPGGYKQHVFHGTDLRGGQAATLRTRDNAAKVRFVCPAKTYGACAGTIRMDAMLDGRRVTLGSATFDTPSSYSGTVEIPLTKTWVRRIEHQHDVKAFLTASSHDDPEHDKRTYGFRALPRQRDDVVQVQRKVTYATITVHYDG